MGQNRTLRMTIAGRLIDLLGHQMYGGPVPAVAELIANAWDADANKVEIKIPSNFQTSGSEIRVRDYGEGMTFNELNDYYLTIGYERRTSRGERTESGRLVMGRKGIGKLAVFGIAEDMILRSVKEGRVVQFSLNYTALKTIKGLNNYEFEPEVDEPSTENSGVTVILRNLKLSKGIGLESFRKSMSRRFALNTEIMPIFINGIKLSKEHPDLEYRIPIDKDNWAEEEIPGFGKVKYWFGFLQDTIKDPELRGISVFARDRIAQFTPFHFNLTGGISGQVGLEYLTGQVKADALDDRFDYIATDRQSVNWRLGEASVLEKWGQEKIRQLCKEWKKRKDQKNQEKYKHSYSEFYSRISSLHEQERKDVISALDKIAALDHMQPEDFRIIANSLISGVERESVRKVIKKINTIDEHALPALYEVIKEWDIISAVSTAEVIFGKIEIVKQFKKHIENRLPEKSSSDKLDMQDFIKEHPWLLGYEYEQLKPADFHHEHGVDKWINDVLRETDEEYKTGDEREKRRFDLLCIKNDWVILILELMRPGKPADYDHVMRLNRYVTRIETAINDKGTAKIFQGKAVSGILIADEFSKDSSLSLTLQSLSNRIEAISWKGLFDRVYSSYKDYLEILKMKAPEDPRIKGLVHLDQ